MWITFSAGVSLHLVVGTTDIEFRCFVVRSLGAGMLIYCGLVALWSQVYCCETLIAIRIMNSGLFCLLAGLFTSSYFFC